MANRLLIRVQVTKVADVATHIKSYQLNPMYRSTMPPFQAGDHIRLRLASGLLRSFSLCGDPCDLSSYRIAVLREDKGRGGSRAIHEDVRVGDQLHVSFPQPGLQLAHDARRHVLIAGGIGITPFLGMLIANQSNKFNIELHYAAKSRSAAAFLPQLYQHLAENLHTYFSADSRRLDIESLLATPEVGTHIYICGPERLVAAALAIAVQQGWPDESIHVESFTGLNIEEANSGDPFGVSLLISKRDLNIPSNKSLLQVLREENIPIEYSCEGGVCGTCWIEYLHGDPIHRDSFLLPAQRATKIMCCVTRARTHLTLVI